MKTALLALAIVAATYTAASPASARTDIACTMQYAPVCGAKQVQCVTAPCHPVYETYGNSCVLGASGAIYVHEGECTAADQGPLPAQKPYVPPAQCTAWFDGCNRCGIDESGSAFCTQMACMGPTEPGYCTQYGNAPAKPVANPDSPVSSNDAGPTSPAEPAPDMATPAAGTEEAPGPFRALWLRVVSFFDWF